MSGFHAGVALLLAGPVMLLAGYPAILLERLGLLPAAVLLAQMPASLSSQFAFAPAARLGTLWGDRAGLGIAGLLRIVSVGGIGAIVVFASGGAMALVPLLLLHAVLGVGFALMQVNGICRAVALHPSGTAAAVGAFHMAGGVGMVIGAVGATVLAFWWPLWVACAAALACTCLGAFLAFHHKGQEAAPG